MRAKWRSPRRAGSSVLKKALDTPNIVRDGRPLGGDVDPPAWLDERIGLLTGQTLPDFLSGGS
jgi:hypothetical protein